MTGPSPVEDLGAFFDRALRDTARRCMLWGVLIGVLLTLGVLEAVGVVF